MLAIIFETLFLCIFFVVLMSNISKIKKSASMHVANWYLDSTNRELVNGTVFLVFMCGICAGTILVSIGYFIFN